MGCYDGWYLFSDVDGTLMTDTFTIPEPNLRALEEFTEGGGHFALASGRGVTNTRDFACKIHVNAPCVLTNGGLIYDYDREQVLLTTHLSTGAPKLLALILQAWPALRVTVWTRSQRYEVGAAVNLPPNPNFVFHPDKITEPWSKLVVCVTPDQQQEVRTFLEREGAGEFVVTVSSDWFVEVLPIGVSKGMGVAFLAKYLGLENDRIAVAGDYLNDYTMLALPGVQSFCPENAHPDIQKICRHRLCHVKDGFLAQVIKRLESL